MTIVLVERAFPEPVSFGQIEDIHRRLQWCLDVNAGLPLLHGLDGSRRRSLCLYEAPDADAIRRVSRQAGLDRAPKIWAASMHGPWRNPGAPPKLQPGENTFALLDRVFDSPVAFEAFDGEEVADDACLPVYGVRFLATFVSLDRIRVVRLYAAPDLEAVRGVNRIAGYPFADVWSAEPHEAG